MNQFNFFHENKFFKLIPAVLTVLCFISLVNPKRDVINN